MKTVSDGTIRKRQKHNGRWEWQALLHVTEDGKRRQVTKYTGIECLPLTPDERGAGRRLVPSGKGANKAVAFLREWRAEVIAAEMPTRAKSGRTVLEFLDWYWSTRSVEAVTRDGYAKLRKHFEHTALGDMDVSEVEPSDVQSWVDERLAGGTGAPTVKKAFDQLKYACRWGVRMRVLDSNPCDLITPPKKAHRDPNPLDDASIAKLNELLDNLREAGETQAALADAATLALLTGMRLGELCGLDWNDVDGGADGDLREDGLIHVNNVVTAPKGGAQIKPYPKNRERRDVPMNGKIVALLKARRERFTDLRSENLSGCYVFARPETAENFMSTGYLGHRWNTFIAMTGLRGVQGLVPHFHDLRHTFATQALIHGIDVVTVAAILGHKNTSTTLKCYARWMPNANADAMARMGEVIG